MGLSAGWNFNIPREMIPDLTTRIFNLKNQGDFTGAALAIFKIQAENNPVYKDFLHQIGIDKAAITSVKEIPFLPVEFFRSHKIITGSLPVIKIFESSGTTGASVSRHYLVDTEIYKRSFLQAFSLFYGDPSEYFIAALLPSYAERENSSLVYMMANLIKASNDTRSGFFKNNIRELISTIGLARAEGRKIFLMGVSFALLDLAEKFSPDLSDSIIMETGGMKGRKKEITRTELHSILKNRLNVKVIHSEYSMTELLSQAYSKGNGIFRCPPWMKILIRDPQDPLSIITEPGRTGGISIIDLANLYSCSFIATNDLGRLHKDGGFEVLGRFDASDIRGCNLLSE